MWCDGVKRCRCRGAWIRSGRAIGGDARFPRWRFEAAYEASSGSRVLEQMPKGCYRLVNASRICGLIQPHEVIFRLQHDGKYQSVHLDMTLSLRNLAKR
jgi:hypothetical protein